MVKICLLDMDGVIVDFIGYLIGKFGGDKNILINSKKYPLPFPLEYYVPEHNKNRVYTDWKIEDWVSMKKLPWADDLIQYLELTFGKENIYFCSDPGVPSTPWFEISAIGKGKWIKNNYPDYTNRLILTRNKEALAAPEKLLLDDTETVLASFINNKGVAILVPNYWNTGYSFLLNHKDEGVYGSKASAEVFKYLVSKIDQLTRRGCCGRR